MASLVGPLVRRRRARQARGIARNAAAMTHASGRGGTSQTRAVPAADVTSTRTARAVPKRPRSNAHGPAKVGSHAWGRQMRTLLPIPSHLRPFARSEQGWQ
jgi:hypothetical protein